MVVFAAPSPVGRLGLAKPAGAGKRKTRRALFLMALLTSSVFKKPSFIPPSSLSFLLLALPAFNSLKKAKAKFSGAGENFAQRYLLNDEKLKEESNFLSSRLQKI